MVEPVSILSLLVVGAAGGVAIGWQICEAFCRSHINKRLHIIEDNYMKESEVKALVAAAAGKTEEALGEIGTRIAAMQQQIDDLIAGAGDPDVTDEAFLADLNKLKANTDALADIVPNPVP